MSCISECTCPVCGNEEVFVYAEGRGEIVSVDCKCGHKFKAAILWQQAAYGSEEFVFILPTQTRTPNGIRSEDPSRLDQ